MISLVYMRRMAGKTGLNRQREPKTKAKRRLSENLVAKRHYPRRKKSMDVRLERQPRAKKALIQKTCNAVVNGLAKGRIDLVRMEMVRKVSGKKKAPMLEVLRRLKEMGAFSGERRHYRNEARIRHEKLFRAADIIWEEKFEGAIGLKIKYISVEELRKKAKEYGVPAKDLARLLDDMGLEIYQPR